MQACIKSKSGLMTGRLRPESWNVPEGRLLLCLSGFTILEYLFVTQSASFGSTAACLGSGSETSLSKEDENFLAVRLIGINVRLNKTLILTTGVGVLFLIRDLHYGCCETIPTVG